MSVLGFNKFILLGPFVPPQVRRYWGFPRWWDLPLPAFISSFSSCLWSCVIPLLFLWLGTSETILLEQSLHWSGPRPWVCPGPTGEKCSVLWNSEGNSMFYVTPEITPLDKNTQPLLFNWYHTQYYVVYDYSLGKSKNPGWGIVKVIETWKWIWAERSKSYLGLVLLL